MTEQDLKIVRKNFERDGYLVPVLLAWAPHRPATIALKGLIQVNRSAASWRFIEKVVESILLLQRDE